MSYDGDPYGDMDSRPANPRPQGNRPPQQQSKKPNLDGYTEVKTRIQEFYATYPTGAIVTTNVKVIPFHEFEDGKSRVLVKAKAYRQPDDPHPGRGASWMVIPGKTPYTNGSEVENCETSAWGRAIAAVGIAIDKGIASAQEIRNARGEESEPPSVVGAQQLAQAAAEAAGPPEPEPAPAETSPEPDGATETTEAPKSGTGGRSRAKKSTEVKEEAIPTDAALAVAAVESGAADPEDVAALIPGPERGISYDEFINMIREKFIPNGAVQAVARELVEQGTLPAIGSVRDLTDQQRLTLFYAAVIRNDDAPPTA
jgi:hypothetical protein